MKWSILTVLIINILYFNHLSETDHDSYAGSQEQVQEFGSPIVAPISSNWVATDAIGRDLPTHTQVGSYKKNKYVGIFYFLLHGQYKDRAVYDISAIARANPTIPKFGPEAAWHWWGEPEVGYFMANDPWVIRRNLQLLTLAGVDILFFDTTNADTYLPVVKKICEISVDMRKNGMPTPYICFVTYTRSAQTVESVYQNFYSQNQYAELWFRWQGKPLILGKIEEMTNPVVKDFFTWRYSWAWTNARNEPHHWQWLDRTPQNYGWDKDSSVPEEISVAVASHPFDNSIGKSYRRGQLTVIDRQGMSTQTQKGLYFDEQWKRALEVDPAVVFVTGWNEWVGQRFINKSDASVKTKSPNFMGKPMKQGQTFFVDLYNAEYNRDIDPMKGGYTDSYYYQLIANVRRFKGMPNPEKASPPQTIGIDGKFEEWTKVTPNFVDPVGDVTHRNWPRSDNKMNYVNNTGRNDIRFCRVAYDSKNIYFYAKTVQKLTRSTDKNWMLLFIDTDRSTKTGWKGYDFLINKFTGINKSTVCKWNGKAWISVATVPFRYTGSELELSIPLNVVNQTRNGLGLYFHWADNILKMDDINEFFLNGDSAPDRRFNYHYSDK